MSKDKQTENKQYLKKQYPNKQLGISYFGFRIIAMITMLVDHVTALILDKIPMGEVSRQYFVEIPRYFGRLSMPIFAFFISEGMIRTSNAKKYLFRLFILSIISEIPYDLAVYGKVFTFEKQNSVFGLLFGALLIYSYDVLKSKGTKIHILLQTLLIILVTFLSIVLNVEYMYFVPLLIFIIYLCRDDYYKMFYASSAAFLFIYSSSRYIEFLRKGIRVPMMGLLSNTMCEAVGLVSLYLITNYYNKEKGRKIPKLISYLFYPLHLLILYFFE